MAALVDLDVLLRLGLALNALARGSVLRAVLSMPSSKHPVAQDSCMNYLVFCRT
jgi:hypothetical protein